MKVAWGVAVSSLIIVGVGCSEQTTSLDDEEEFFADGYVFEPWASSEGLEIAIHSSDGNTRFLTRGHKDFKPSWSTDGSRLTFFRMLEYEPGFGISRTNIGVIAEDGTGLRLLTSGDHADFNPTWTRDGTHSILFTRYWRVPWDVMKIYLISPDGLPGDEISLSDPSPHYSEWAASGLKDGRIFIDRIGDGFRSYLLTPEPGEKGTYEEVQRNTSYFWHKLSVSPSETKVAYMRYGPNDRPFEDAVICYADFDVEARVISNHVQVTAPNPNASCEYPRWTGDEKYLIYDCNDSGRFQIYAYRLSDGYVRVLSPNPGVDSQYGNLFGIPK
jgi:hypothetical protein